MHFYIPGSNYRCFWDSWVCCIKPFLVLYAEHSFLLWIIFIPVSKQQVSKNNTYTQRRTFESLATCWQCWSCTEWSWEAILKCMVKLWKVLRAVASVTSANSCEYFSEKWSLLTTLVGYRKEKKSHSPLSVSCYLWKKLLMLQTLGRAVERLPNI